MFFVDMLLAASISFVIGFTCGAEWKDKLLQKHMEFLRECANSWSEKYTKMLMQKIRDENK